MFCTTPFMFMDHAFRGVYVPWKNEDGYTDQLDLTLNRQFTDPNNNQVLVFDLSGVTGDPPVGYPGRQREWLTVVITDEQIRLKRNEMTEPLPDGGGWCECASMSNEEVARAVAIDVAGEKACEKFNITYIPFE